VVYLLCPIPNDHRARITARFVARRLAGIPIPGLSQLIGHINVIRGMFRGHLAFNHNQQILFSDSGFILLSQRRYFPRVSR
jgi:hypothetical protein